MTTTSDIEEIQSERSERREGFQTLLHRAYKARMGDTLASVNLERGDALPDDSDAEIVASEIVPAGQSGHRIVLVEAVKFHYET